MYVEKPTDPGESLVGLSNLFLFKFLLRNWFLCYTTNTKGKECGLVLSSRLWGGALRDDTKNGCVADYSACLLYTSDAADE